MRHRTLVMAAWIASLCGAVLTPRRALAEDADGVARAQREFIRAHGDRPISAIRLDGLERSHPVVVEQWIDCRVGQPLSSCDLPEIRERIYRLAIFSGIDIELNEQPAGVELVFRVEEKWTLYPVPMLWYSPGTEIAGLILVEANTFGYNKGVAVGAVYSNRGWYALAGYNDPNIGFTSLFGSFHSFLGSGIVENETPEGTVEQSYDLTRLDLEYQLGWTFWDRLSPTWTGGVRAARVDAVHVPGTEPAATATVAMQGLLFVYSDRVYRDFYDEGLRLSTELQHAFPLDDQTSPYSDLIFDAKLTKPAPLRGALGAHFHGFAGSVPVVFEERLGGLDGSRTLQGGGLIAADRYASLSMAYEVPILTVSPGVATAVLFGEAGRYARNAEHAINYGGPGVGLRFLLDKVAMPAAGLDVGYEVGSKRFAFSVAIGYRPLR
jgi:hypothetical protein